MKPTLYSDRRSPPVRSILLLIEELGIDVDEKVIDLFKGEHYSEDYLKINPCHTVPAFQDSDVTLTDSHAILIYLCEKYGKENNNLWPTDQLDRIQVLNKLFYSGTLLFRRDSDCFGQIIIHKLKKEQVEEHAEKLREQFGFLEKFLTEHKFIATDYMTIADLSIAPIVSTVNIIVPITAEKWPKLYDWWHNQMQSLPYYQQVNDNGVKALKELVRESTDYEINEF